MEKVYFLAIITMEIMEKRFWKSVDTLYKLCIFYKKFEKYEKYDFLMYLCVTEKSGEIVSFLAFGQGKRYIFSQKSQGKQYLFGEKSGEFDFLNSWEPCRALAAQNRGPCEIWGH